MIHDTRYIQLSFGSYFSLFRVETALTKPAGPKSSCHKLKGWMLPARPTSSCIARGLPREAELQSFRRPQDTQPPRHSRREVAENYPRLADHRYVMQQAGLL